MSDDANSKSGKTWLYVFGLLVSLPVCYVFSVGPACVLFYRGLLSSAVFVGIYTPLEWAVPLGSPLAPPIEDYIQLWLSLTGTLKP